MFDIPGMLVVVALIALFGFLTTRAWRLRNPLLKWPAAILAGLLTLLPTLVGGLALNGYARLNQHYDNPVSNLKAEGTSAQIARGEQLAHTCQTCHATNSRLPLAGTDFLAKFAMPPLGTLHAPNLTPGGNIDDWSDGELVRAIREGIGKDGRSLLIMPANTLRHLSDADVLALVAYLRAQPAIGGPAPPANLNLLGALFTNLADFRTAQPPVGSVSAPALGTLAYGKYMVDILGCADCHGDRLQGKVDSGAPGPPPGPNLTAIVPQWSEAQFMTFFNTGTRPDGSQVPILTLPSGFSSPRMPWDEFRAAASDDELKAMYAYLHSLPPAESPPK